MNPGDGITLLAMGVTRDRLRPLVFCIRATCHLLNFVVASTSSVINQLDIRILRFQVEGD